jgi:hypothetical protein
MSTCLPVTAYGIFMSAAILYYVFYAKNAKQGAWYAAYFVAGVVLLWILCAAGMDLVAWGLLGIPVIFYIFLIAIVVFDQAFNVSRIYAKKADDCPVEEDTCGPDEEEVIEECEDE